MHAADASENSRVELVNSDIDCSWANSFDAIDSIIIENNVFRCSNPYYESKGYGYGVNTYAPIQELNTMFSKTIQGLG